MTRRSLPLLVLVTLLAGSCTIPRFETDRDRESPRSAPTVQIEQDDSPPPSSDVADVIESVLPSVVNIRVRSVQSTAFGRQERGGEGSGVIIDGDGVILTNNHVVACATEVRVAFNDGRDEMDGEVVGTVPEKDLAIVRVDADDLKALTVGRSGRLRLGDPVLAIGFPLGLGETPTVTRGIISGKARAIRAQTPGGGVEALEDLLQTDAAINPGNSGGALIDLAGRLVGINTAGVSAAAGENVGFAIPIDGAIEVVEDIFGDVDKGWLGVSIGSVDSARIAEEVGVDEDVRGAVILGLLPGPAEDSGLREGDVIVSIAGREIGSAEELGEVLEERGPGDRVEVEVVREDETRTFQVRLGQRPPAEEIVARDPNCS
ncbi:MAG: PDZ domain-containing protein [Actinobacteria bacterium]|nr:PDZ domain-containing protein [Actinomycetota bacterium]